MGRGGGRRSSSPRSSGNAPASRRAPPPAPPPQAAPPATQQGGGMMSNLAGSVVGGIGTGVGFSVANRAVDAVMGPRKTEVVHTHQDGQPAPAAAPAAAAAPVMAAAPTGGMHACQQQMDDLNQCLGRHGDATLCQQFFDNLKSCQTGTSGFS
eukprot:Selendium_serpulae@DN6292_c0_g1_i1.p1